MFQRLQKGFNLDFLDNKLAEEQERQKPAKRSPSAARARRGGDGRTESPGRKAGGSRLQVADARRSDGSPARRGPDPEEFAMPDDTAEEGSSSRMGAPMPVKDGTQGEALPEQSSAPAEIRASMDKGKEREMAAPPPADDELPLEVRKKLDKLEVLTTRYQDLLRNYRTAHAHFAAIEPFEATLREHTPLTSISDPAALVEFLNQRSRQSEMVMEELKRISGEHKEAVRERDELKVKLDEAEKATNEAFDEAAGLRRERDEARAHSPTKSAQETSQADPLGVSGANGTTGHHETAQVSTPKTEESEHVARIEELETEVRKSTDYINELLTDNATVQRSLDMTQLELSAMVNKLGTREEYVKDIQSQLNATRAELDEAASTRQAAIEQEHEVAAILTQTESEVVVLQGRLKEYQESLEEKAAVAEENLRKYQEEHKQNLNTGVYVQREEKRMSTLQDLVNTLNKGTKSAASDKKVLEGQIKDLERTVKILESEGSTRGALVESLRGHEEVATSLRKRLLDVERERDDAQRLADSKKGHEQAAASLRSQLKRAEKERDTAYKMIIDCGKCSVPAAHEDEDAKTERSLSTTERSTGTPEPRSRPDSSATQSPDAGAEGSIAAAAAAADGNALAPPKSKKKKSKSKKKAPAAEDGTASTMTTDSKEGLTPEMLAELRTQPGKLTEMFAKFWEPEANQPMMLSFMESMYQQHETRSSEHETLIKHHEDRLEEADQRMRDDQLVLRAKEDEIFRLQAEMGRVQGSVAGEAAKGKLVEELQAEIGELQRAIAERDGKIEELRERLEGEAALTQTIEDLREEVENSRESVLELGSEATDAKFELKKLRESSRVGEGRIDELQREYDDSRKKLKGAEAQKAKLEAKCASLEADMADLQTKQADPAAVAAIQAQLDSLQKEHETLQTAKHACDEQISALKAQHTTATSEMGSKHTSLTSEISTLRIKTTGLEKELAASESLAQSRYKDVTTIRELYNKVQPELKRLRDESTELKALRTELDTATAGVRRLEGRERDLRAEVTLHRSQAAGKEKEMAELQERMRRSEERGTVLEESYETARRDLERCQGARDDAVESREKAQAELAAFREEVRRARVGVEEAQANVRKFSAEAAALRDERQLAAAKHESAQTQLQSLDAQTRELGVQMRELRERNLALDEEVADARRMLAERGRDAETLRRLLGEAQARAEADVRDVRGKLDLAVEERERAEEALGTIGRKRGREVEALKARVAEVEREAARAKEAVEAAEKREAQGTGLRQDLEARAAQAATEVEDVRAAMGKLQDSLDERERYARDVERAKVELASSLSEKDARLEKLTKSSRSMAEELKRLQQSSSPSPKPNTPASNRLRQASTDSTGTANGTPAHGRSPAATAVPDTTYIKNVLLQFLEQREKKNQMQLVPVLGRLLQFERGEEERWVAAIGGR